MVKVSLKTKAYQSDGFSRSCNRNCPCYPCTVPMRKYCTARYVEGYMKGYKRAKKDMKESNGK